MTTDLYYCDVYCQGALTYCLSLREISLPTPEIHSHVFSHRCADTVYRDPLVRNLT